MNGTYIRVCHPRVGLSPSRGFVTLAYAGVQAIATRKTWIPDYSGMTKFSPCLLFSAQVSAIRVGMTRLEGVANRLNALPAP